MADIEGMARLMYWLEMTINQGKLENDWDEQPESMKDEWRRYAGAVYRLTA